MHTHDTESSTIKVWDSFIRIFHWSLVFFFLFAYVTEDWESMHILAGYVVAILMSMRLIWGLVGTRHARFISFVKSPATVLRYFKSMLSLKVPHYQGHNPVAAVMVIALLASIALISLTGFILIAIEGSGPLAGTFLASISEDLAEGAHEFFANLTLLLVIVHVLGVLVSSLLEGENLAKAMVTGRKQKRDKWEDQGPG